MAEDSLEPLVTQCPTCRTRFRVTEVQLNVAGGRVRCGACLSVFPGLENLVLGAAPRLQPGESADAALDELLDELREDSPPLVMSAPPAKAAVTGRAARAGARANAVTPAADEPTQGQATVASTPDPEPEQQLQSVDAIETATDAARSDLAQAAAEAESAAAQAAEITAVETLEAVPDAPARIVVRPRAASGRSVPDDSGANSPVAVRSPRQPQRQAPEFDVDPDELVLASPRRRRRWWVLPMLLLFLALLGAQVLYFQFDAWARNPQFRPAYEWLCPRLGCTLPELRAIDKMLSKNLVVRANPDVSGGLLIDAIIVNQATFSQRFPVIELRFSSMGGNVIAERLFRPDEYLAGELQGARMMAPLTPVHIALAIDDPGQDAVNYVMLFR